MEETKAERKARKAQRRLEKENAAFLKHQKNVQQNDAATILCVRFGNKYPISYVEKLRNMIARNITLPYKLYCLTDDPTPIQDVELILQKNAGYAKGWWHKVHMFDPKLPLTGRILYMDLDVVVCSNIDKLLKLPNNTFYGIRDFNRKFHPSWKYLNSSVMSWIHGRERVVWDRFVEAPNVAMRMHGDQDWTWKTCKDRIVFWPETWIQSYKWEIRRREELHVAHGVRQFREVDHNAAPHVDCCIAVFHGSPNPEMVQDKFVVDNWV